MRIATHEKGAAWTMAAVLLLALGSACTDSDGGGGAGGGTGAAAGSGATSGTAGAGGATTSTSSCSGDQTTWDSLTAGPFTCNKNSDCCVIINGCTTEAQVVSAANRDAAKAAWPYCPNDCTNCIPPAVEVGCNNGVCTGTEVDVLDASADLLTDHCGVDGPDVVLGQLSFACG